MPHHAVPCHRPLPGAPTPAPWPHRAPAPAPVPALAPARAGRSARAGRLLARGAALAATAATVAATLLTPLARAADGVQGPVQGPAPARPAAGAAPALDAAQAPQSPQAAPAAVGFTRLTLAGLPVTLVYPTDATASARRFGPFELTVALDAAPAPGSRRLVLMSHGTGGNALSDHAMAATLARAGFVVAQPEHAGDNAQDQHLAGPASWALRPQEASRVIDALAAHPDWAPRLRLDRVGVHGMSAGGVTALALAGARWRTLNLLRHCQAHADEDLGFCFNGLPDAAAQAQRRQQYERTRDLPEAYLPAELTREQGGRLPPAGVAPAGGFDPRPDPRIAAATLAVPLAAVFSAESLQAIPIPVGVVAAARDQLLLPAFHSAQVLRHCGRCTLLTELPGAGHFDLLAPWPADLARAIGQRQARGGLPEPGFDPALRQAAFEQVAAFLREQLR